MPNDVKLSEKSSGSGMLSWIHLMSLYGQKYPQLIWENFDNEIHHDIGIKELGYENKKSKKELREIFEWKLKNIFMPH